MAAEKKRPTVSEGWKRRAAIVWSGQACSYISTQAATFTVMWFITESTSSPGALAVAGIAGLLPAALLSPFGGVAADRHYRKGVIIAADGIAGLLSFVLALALIFDVAILPVIVVLLAIRSAATAFHGPALSAMMPQIVPESRLMAVNALDQMLISTAGIAGPVLGALLYGAFGIASALILDAGCAAIACLCLVAAKIPVHSRTAHSERDGVWGSMQDGFRCIWNVPGVRILMVVEMLGLALFMPFASLEPLMVYGVFGGDSWSASFAEAAFSVGILLGSGVAMAATGIPRKVPLVLGSGVVMGLCLVGCGLLPPSGYLVFVVLFSFAGIGMGAYAAPIMPLVQRHVPEDHLGRVMGVYSSGVLLASPVGLALSGFVAESVGIASWFVVCGVLMAVVHGVAFASGSLRKLDE